MHSLGVVDSFSLIYAAHPNHEQAIAGGMDACIGFFFTTQPQAV